MNDNQPLTHEEQERLEWCLSILDEDNLAECNDEAEQIAYREYFAFKAYEDLLPLLVKIRMSEMEARA